MQHYMSTAGLWIFPDRLRVRVRVGQEDQSYQLQCTNVERRHKVVLY